MTRHIHLIGIGGSGLSAIARVLLERGLQVSGSDRQLSPLAQDLAEAGAQIFTGHAAANIVGADLVVRSSAVPDSNPEVLAAQAAGIPVVKRADFLEQLIGAKTGLAVAGTHGKTTTTAMLAWTLYSLGLDPSYIIGGVSCNLGGNAHAGSGEYFAIEADEYDRMFLGLSPRWTILTHLEHDHPDIYPTLREYKAAFAAFIQQIQPGGGLLACADHADTQAMLTQVPAGASAWSYGISARADYTATSLCVNSLGGTSYTVRFGANPGEELAKIDLRVPGRHNVCNSLAVLALAHRLGLPVASAAAALGQFTGTGRRFDLLGESGGIAVYNDYAHHPTEIRATLEAARTRFPGRQVWALWQPHTYSRTQTLFAAFCHAFSDADQVLVTEIYAARESNPGFSAAQVVRAMPHPAARFIPTLAAARDLLMRELRPGDVLLVLSAGDADQVSQQVLDGLRAQEASHA
jgi:UDP-N-acetylmuramate--alanine ligase